MSQTTARSMVDLAYEDLQRRIITLDITPGAPLSDDELSRELGVGRTPVREALKRLEVDRLVVTYARRGTFATRVDITDLGFISEIRAELEPLAAGRAARVASPVARTALEEALETALQRDRADVLTVLEADAAVHRAIYAAAANPYLEDSLVRYNNLATRIWCLVMDRLVGVGGHLHEHQDLVRAILDREPDRAAALSRAHVAHFEATVREALLTT